MPTVLEIQTEFDNSETIKGLAAAEKEVVKTTRSLAQLEKQQEELNDAFREADPGTERYRELQKELVEVSREIKNVELSVEALDTDQVASEIGGLVGGFSDVATGAVFAFGISEESAEAFFQTLAQVEGAGRLVKGSIEATQAAIKLYNNQVKTGALLTKAQSAATFVLAGAQKAYNAVVGQSTGVLKGFRVALAATGVGALVVGIGLLISNFETVIDWVGNAVEAFGGLKNVILALLGPIGLLILAYESLFGSITDGFEEEAKRAQQRKEDIADLRKELGQQIDTVNELRKAEAEAFEDKQKALDLEIDRLEATGQASFDVKVQKLQDIIDEEKAILESNERKIQAWTEYYTNLAILNGQSEEEFKESLKRQGIDLDNLLAQAQDLQADQQDRIFAAETDLLALQTENNKKRIAEAQKTADELARIEAELLKRRVEAIKALDQLEIDLIEDDLERSQRQLIFRFEQRIATLSEKIPEENQLIIALTQQLQDELLKLEEQFNNDLLQKEFEFQQNLDDLRIQLLENRRVTEEEQFALDREIADARFNEEIENLTFQLQQQELTEEEFRLRKQLAEQEHQNELNRIEEEGAEFRKQKAIDEANAKIETTEFFLNTAVSLNDSFNKIQDNLLKEGEELSIQQQKRRFNRDKAFNIAQALIDGASAGVKAIAQYGPPPSPLGIAGLASAGAITAANVAAIATQQFNPSGGSGGSGGANAAGTAGFSPTTAAGGGGQASVPTTSTGLGGAITQGQQAGTNQQAGGAASQPIQAFVLTNPLADAMDASKAIQNQSELGG